MPDSSSVHALAYRAFISYSHRDKAWADWLHRSLETYRVPSRLVGTETTHGKIPRRLHPIFRDREELASATDLGRKVNEALAQSENLIVICSPASATSRWVSEEVLAYKRLGRGERIFCLIVGGEPDATNMPGREAEECFCPALRFRLDANGQPTTERTEPIAADARPGKDGKANAKLKLIAGMLDVGFDALKQREQQRRVRRMTAIAAAALMIMAATIVLSIFAMVSRHHAVVAEQHAETERYKAIVARQAAVRRQKQAEGLIDFMLGDLTTKLEAESRLDILQGVDDKAMAYFKSLPPTDVNDTTLVQRALTLEKIGGNRMVQGNLVGALEAFHASTAISARLADAEPGNVERHVAWSRTLTFIGTVYQTQLKLADAEQVYATARQVLQPALKTAPDNLDLLQQLSYVDNNDGQVQEDQGDLDAARSNYETMLHAARTLIAADPSGVAYEEIIIVAHENLADLAMQPGDLANAIGEYRAVYAAANAARDRHPHDNYMLALVAGRGTAGLGPALPWIGEAEQAERYLQQGVETMQALVKSDPGNTDYQDYFAKLSSDLARVQRARGDSRSAGKREAESLAILANLVKKDPSNQDWQNDYGRALIEQSAEMYAAGDTKGTRASAQHALQILEPMLAKQPEQRDTLLATMQARLLLASATPDRQAAQTLREQVLEAMQAVKVGKNDPRLLALQVEALLALDRKPEAQPLIKQLWNEGYRDPYFVALLQRERIDYPANPAFEAKLAATTAQAADPAPTAKVNPTKDNQGVSP